MEQQLHRTLFAADCLDVLNDESAIPTASVDLIYLDPPFNSKSQYNLPFKSKDKSLKPVEAFNDIWRWTVENDEDLRRLKLHPQINALAEIVRFAQRISGNMTGGAKQVQSRLIPAEYGISPVGDAPRLERYRQHIPALRPDGQPLS